MQRVARKGIGGVGGFDQAASPLRVFGSMLRFYRNRAGMSQEDLGARIHFSGDLIGKIEMGQRTPTEEFTVACEAVPELATAGALTELRKVLKDYLKHRAYPGWFLRWPDKEAEAQILRWYELVVVPGLLQTEDYARALLDGRIGARSEDVDEGVAARLERQEILHRDNGAPELWVVIDEGVLHRRVGSPDVMREQLERLVEAARRPNIVVQVIPASVGVHDGLPGSFVIAHCDGAPAAAYQDTAVRGQVIEDPDDISALMATWDKLRAEALPRRASLELVEEVGKEWT